MFHLFHLCFSLPSSFLLETTQEGGPISGFPLPLYHPAQRARKDLLREALVQSGASVMGRCLSWGRAFDGSIFCGEGTKTITEQSDSWSKKYGETPKRILCKTEPRRLGCLVSLCVGFWLIAVLVAWLVGWLVGRLVGWSVGWSVGRLVGWLVGWLVGRLVG